MAGGMERRPSWGSLEDRTARMRDQDASAGPRSGDRSGQRGHPFPRHVWVNVTGRSDDRWPGVLIDWRRSPGGGWQALVVWVQGGGMQEGHAHVSWVAAAHVGPT